jgi:hypothetical protein
MKRQIFILTAALMMLAAVGLASQASKSGSHAEDSGFVSIFDGKTLKGWHVSAKTQHGSGGRWVIENGPAGGQVRLPRVSWISFSISSVEVTRYFLAVARPSRLNLCQRSSSRWSS